MNNENKNAAEQRVTPVKVQPTGPKQEDQPVMSEGVRAEIEQTGEAIDPATGKKLTTADLPKSK